MPCCAPVHAVIDKDLQKINSGFTGVCARTDKRAPGFSEKAILRSYMNSKKYTCTLSAGQRHTGQRRCLLSCSCQVPGLILLRLSSAVGPNS